MSLVGNLRTVLVRLGAFLAALWTFVPHHASIIAVSTGYSLLPFDFLATRR